MDVYYNEGTPSLDDIDEPDESDYYKVYKDQGLIDDFLILDENQWTAHVIFTLLFDWDVDLEGYN